MLFYNLLLIIRQLQPSVDFAVRDQQEIILKYRKHEALNDYIEQDKIRILHSDTYQLPRLVTSMLLYPLQHLPR